MECLLITNTAHLKFILSSKFLLFLNVILQSGFICYPDLKQLPAKHFHLDETFLWKLFKRNWLVITYCEHQLLDLFIYLFIEWITLQYISNIARIYILVTGWDTANRYVFPPLPSAPLPSPPLFFFPFVFIF